MGSFLIEYVYFNLKKGTPLCGSGVSFVYFFFAFAFDSVAVRGSEWFTSWYCLAVCAINSAGYCRWLWRVQCFVIGARIETRHRKGDMRYTCRDWVFGSRGVAGWTRRTEAPIENLWARNNTFTLKLIYSVGRKCSPIWWTTLPGDPILCLKMIVIFFGISNRGSRFHGWMGGFRAGRKILLAVLFSTFLSANVRFLTALFLALFHVSRICRLLAAHQPFEFVHPAPATIHPCSFW